MQDRGPRPPRSSHPVNKDQSGQTAQNVQNGVTINRVVSPKNRNTRPVPSGNNGTRTRKRLTRKQVGKRIALAIVSLLVILAIGAALLWNYIFSGLDTQNPSGTGFPTEALTNKPPESKDITNILLLGVDTRDPKKELGLSDAIIILTIDRKNNVIKMTSIMRDCYVYVPGYKAPMKINEAHSLGGPELAMRTINNTLRLNIQKYMVVNFQSMAAIIDIAGGVTLTITEAERMEINPYATSSKPIKSAGIVKLNGDQAVNFARIRYIDSDAERTRRQRDVLSALFLGFKEANPMSKAQMIQKGLSQIITNMSATEITSLGIDVLPKMANEMQQLKLPLDGYYTVNSTGVWYMNVDYNRMIPKVYEFIYGVSHPFDPVPTIRNVTQSPVSKSSSISSSEILSSSADSSSDASSISTSTSTSTSASSSSSSMTSGEPTATPTPATPSSTISESASASMSGSYSTSS